MAGLSNKLPDLAQIIRQASPAQLRRIKAPKPTGTGSGYPKGQSFHGKSSVPSIRPVVAATRGFSHCQNVLPRSKLDPGDPIRTACAIAWQFADRSGIHRKVPGTTAKVQLRCMLVACQMLDGCRHRSLAECNEYQNGMATSHAHGEANDARQIADACDGHGCPRDTCRACAIHGQGLAGRPEQADIRRHLQRLPRHQPGSRWLYPGRVAHGRAHDAEHAGGLSPPKIGGL